MTEYCPDCVVQLNRQSKKLGHNSVWVVCPKCGFRKRPITEQEVIIEVGIICDIRTKINEQDFKREDI